MILEVTKIGHLTRLCRSPGLTCKNYTVPTVRPLALSAAAGLIARLFTPSAHLVYATPIVEFFLDQTKYRYKRL